jgi:hypothetical protein
MYFNVQDSFVHHPQAFRARCSSQEWQREQLVAAKTPSKELEELLPALARFLASSRHGDGRPGWINPMDIYGIN